MAAKKKVAMESVAMARMRLIVQLQTETTELRRLLANQREKTAVRYAEVAKEVEVQRNELANTFEEGFRAGVVASSNFVRNLVDNEDRSEADPVLCVTARAILLQPTVTLEKHSGGPIPF